MSQVPVPPDDSTPTTTRLTKRQRAKERLLASERRYRELAAVLEQRVAERTAELQVANALLREREESLQFVLAGCRLAAWDWNLMTGEVTCNDYWTELLGFTPQDVDDALIEGWFELIHPEDREQARQAINAHLSGRGGSGQVLEYRLRTRNGGYRWILDRARIVSRDEAGRPLRMAGILEDITERKHLQEVLEESHRRLMTVLNAMEATIYVADMDTHEILFLNQSARQIFGPVEGQLCYQVLQGLDAPCPFCTNDQLLNADGSPAGVYAREFQNQLNQRWYDLRDCAVRWTDGRLVRMEIATDITDRKRSEEELNQAREAAEAANRALQSANGELQRLATTDRLTGIWNRAYFEEVAAQETARAARYGEPLSLLLFDIDLFKAINDTHGHLIGDQVLIELIRRVGEHLRANDVLARWGGEEFVIMLPHCAAAEALRVAEKLRALVQAQTFAPVGQVTASFGVADFRPTDNLDTWLKRADDALYAAKAAGRNQVCLGASPPS